MNKKYGLIILLVILIAAFLIRFTPTLSERDYWYDEAFTGILLKQSWPEMNDSIFRDVHPPLYYWLAKPVGAIFNYSPEGIRYFSLLFGLATVFSIYWIGKRMFSERAGLLAAAFAAFSPFAIEYSQEARMYALFGFLMLWATWFFYKALEENKIKYWVWWGIFGGLSFYTHYLSLFFFVIFFLAFIFYNRIFIKKENSKNACPVIKFIKSLGILSKGFWLGTGIIAIFFGSWLKIFISHMMKGNLGWIEPSYLSDIPKTLQIFFFGHPAGTGGVPWSNEFKFFFDGSSAGLLILSVLLILFTAAWIKNIKRKETFVLAVISLGTLLFLIVASHFNIKLYVARYFMPAAVLIYLLLAGLLVENFKAKWLWLIAIAIYGVMLLGLKPMKYTSDWSQIYALVNKGEINAKTIIASNPFDYTTAKYYFGQEKVRYYNKSNLLEDFSGWVVVGNENRIDSVEKLKNFSGSIFIDDDNCELEGINFGGAWKLENKSVCFIQ